MFLEDLYDRSDMTDSMEQQSILYRPELNPDKGKFTLWGTRGSIPCSGSSYVRYGGNTSCFEFAVGDERIVFDAGSGIRELGQSLTSSAGPRKIHLFITHTHWDHIQGFPFFLPAYLAGYELNVYAAPRAEHDLESIFRGQLDRAYFPVQMEDMQAKLVFNYLENSPIRIGDVEINWEYTFHPGATVAYKITHAGQNLVYSPDNEFLKGYLGPIVGELNRDWQEEYRTFLDFRRDVDVLIHEAQYSVDEYESKIGWGHTCVHNACSLAHIADVKRWIVIHHDPSHSDDKLDAKLNLTRQMLRDLNSDVIVDHGYDHMETYL